MNEESLDIRRKAILAELAAMQTSQEKSADDAGFNFNNFFTRVSDIRDIRPRKIQNPEFSKMLESIIDNLSLREKLQEQFDIFKYSFERNGQDSDFSHNKFTPEQKLAARSRIQELLIPVYVELRLSGFSHEDICN